MISAIINFHREGLLAGPALRSYAEAIAFAEQAGLEVEPVVMLDRPDAGTKAIVTDFFRNAAPQASINVIDVGDPGLSRNAGVGLANGAFVTFLDGDDLWSFNWIAEAHKTCTADADRFIVHSEVNITFGNEDVVWWHPNSDDTNCDIDYMRIGNYWDALAFARRDVYVRFPFKANDLRAGYGHEDWHWNCVTLAGGLAHVPAKGTIHFKRRRSGSQMAICDDNDVVIWPTELARYGFEMPRSAVRLSPPSCVRTPSKI